jgi:hypothetical protein
VLAFGTSRAVGGQTRCDHEPARSALIGGVIGVAAIVGPAVARDRNGHLDHGEWLPYTGGATWGAVLGSSLGAHLARQRCPAPVSLALPDTAMHCPRSIVRATAAGGAIGGVTAFMIAPFVALPAAVVWSGPGAFERAIGVITAAGAASGLATGAIVGVRRC